MRKLKNWISDYVAYIAPASESPMSYLFWSAATAVSAMLKRSVYVGRGSFKLYPNLYTILVGRPGIGKGSAINPAIALLSEAKGVNIMSDRVTIEFVLEKMATGWASYKKGATGLSVGVDHSCLLVSPEASIFISASNNTLPILADLWDAREGTFTYGTRHKGEFQIKDPCVCFLGGSTQEWLISSIPSNAVGGGFTRRVNFVVANDREKYLPWPVLQNHNQIRDNLVNDLREISRIQGEMKFSPEVVPLFELVYKESTPTEFDDEATTSYKTSMWAQVTKLAMCLSAARGEDLLITKRDWIIAEDAIRGIAKNVTRVFRGVGESDLAIAADKVLRFIENKGFATRKDIIRAHWRDITLDDFDKIILTLKEGNVIYEYFQGKVVVYVAMERKGQIP